MKTLIAAILFCSLSLGVFAQTKQTVKPLPGAKATTTTTKTADSYRCPVCGYTGTAKGACPRDKTDLVKVGDYYCPECYMSSAKAGKCNMCGVDMKKMEASAATGSKK